MTQPKDPNNNAPQKRRQWRRVSHSDARILIAAAEGKMDMMKSCIQNGRSIETLYRRGETPLILAAQSEHVEMVHFLIEQKANINHIDDLGLTPLCYGLMGDKPEIVQALVDQGADLYHKIPKTGQSLIDFVRDNDEIHPDMKPILEEAQKQQRQIFQKSQQIQIKRRPKM